MIPKARYTADGRSEQISRTRAIAVARSPMRNTSFKYVCAISDPQILSIRLLKETVTTVTQPVSTNPDR